MQLQLDHLLTFVAVADSGGFTKAGLRINRTQSAVSMQIKRLESEIGKPLFDRTGRTIVLTPAGQTLLPHARKILSEHDLAVQRLSRPALKGSLCFGSPEHYTPRILPGLLSAFARSYPDIQVEMICENSPEIKKRVDLGEMDIGLCTQIHDGGQTIAHDPVVWMGSPRALPDAKNTVALALFEDGCIFRTWALDALTRAGIPHRIVYVSRSESGIQDAVRAGLAISPVVQSNVPPDLTVVGPELGLPVLPVSNIVLHKRSGPASDIVDCFARHLIQAFNPHVS